MIVQVIDNFLPLYNFKQIESVLMGENFSWFYNPDALDGKDEKKENMFQFTHFIYSYQIEYQHKPQYMPLMEPSLSMLGASQLFRIKANLLSKTTFNRSTGYHVDYPDKIYYKSAILYINTNNGWTHIKGYGKVKSVANRMVIFDGNSEHVGYTCTDKKTRVVINFNYN